MAAFAAHGRMNSGNRFTARLLVGFLMLGLSASFSPVWSPPASAESGTGRASAVNAAKLAHSTTIYRDSYGVPHIYGPTDAACVFGYAYAQAEDNFWQIEDSYIHAVGRATEVEGDKGVQSDLLNRALQITSLSKAEYQRTSAKGRELCDAFVEGLNYFLSHNPQVHARLFTHFDGWQVFAFNRYALYQLFIFGKTGVKLDELKGAVREREIAEQTGSNMWAVTPSRSADGHALLLINPHQPFFGPGQWYEGHVHSEEGWDMSGASFFGSPFPTIGHNEYLGWSHTVNEPDITDAYTEKFDDPANPLKYKYGNEYRTATEWTERLKIKNGEKVQFKDVTFRKTHHGPVIATRGGQAITIKMAMLEEGGQLDEWYAMTRAHNLAEFKSAMSRVAIPMFNAAYADRDGNIFYVYNGAVPRRSEKFDWTRPVDGSNPDTEWHGYHAFADLPQVTNPRSGFVQNCNSSPFTTTSEGNPDKKDFPSYMVREPDNARARISRRILTGDSKFTYAEWAKDAFDTTVIEGETFIPQLAADVAKLGESDPARAAKLKPVIDDLKAWDHVSTVDSKAMTIFAFWVERATRLAQSGDKDPFVRVKALEQVLDELKANFGSWQVAWGEVNRLQRIDSGGNGQFSDARPSLPVAGAPGWNGIVYNFYTRPEKGQKRRYGVAGHSFVSVVDFGPKVEAQSILVFGENADEASPHHFDQAKLYAQKQFKPAWFYLPEIKAHSEQTYHPGEEQSAKVRQASVR